jgi:hypothetical protein
MPLRVVTWNCNMALDRKFERLLSLRPDVAIIQECASPERLAAKGRPLACTAFKWIGFNEDKGLGILTFGDLIVCRHRAYADAFALYLPAVISGRWRFHVLGVWTADPRKVPPGATNDPVRAIGFYRSFIDEASTIVAGDFNRLPQQMTARAKGAGGPSAVELLTNAGLANADYVMSDATGQPALRRTHYHQRHFARGFVVDYLYIPASFGAHLSAFEVGDPHDWLGLSDHVPLVAELDLSAWP